MLDVNKRSRSRERDSARPEGAISCRSCGNPFEPRNGSNAYCSPKCFEDGRRERGRERYRRNAETHRLVARLRRYRLTVAAYEALLERCGGRCEICGDVADLVIDHDHRTSLVRGLLCNRCNSLLHIVEDVDLLASAMAYLERSQQ